MQWIWPRITFALQLQWRAIKKMGRCEKLFALYSRFFLLLTEFYTLNVQMDKEKKNRLLHKSNQIKKIDHKEICCTMKKKTQSKNIATENT